jgi:hypothetical protein
MNCPAKGSQAISGRSVRKLLTIGWLLEQETITMKDSTKDKVWSTTHEAKGAEGAEEKVDGKLQKKIGHVENAAGK